MLHTWQRGGQNRRDVHLCSESRTYWSQLALSYDEDICMDETQPSNQAAIVAKVQTWQESLRKMLQIWIFAHHQRHSGSQAKDQEVLSKSKKKQCARRWREFRWLPRRSSVWAIRKFGTQDGRGIYPVDFELDVADKLCGLGQGMEDTERLTFCKEKKENKTGFSFVRFEPAYFFFKHRSKNTSSNLPNSLIGYKGSLTSFFCIIFWKD